MKALTLWQPWASLVALGHKPQETRSWQTNYRGPLLIHAAAESRYISGATHYIDRCRFGHLLPRGYHFGAVVAAAALVDVVPARTVSASQQDRVLGDYAEGRWVWLLAEIQRLPQPVPAKGRQGLWAPTAALMAEVARQLRTPYRPTSGTEGEAFYASWCASCVREGRDGMPACDIYGRSLAYAITDPDYPAEWIVDAHGPRCTAWSDDPQVVAWQDARCPATGDLFGGGEL